MSEAILRNLYKFPHDIDLVVGIPRSGMLPANLLALFLNKPFADIDSYIDGKAFSTGSRGQYISTDHTNKVLIMDDSINTGEALEKVKSKLSEFSSRHPNIELKYGVVYATSASKDIVDYYCETVEQLRVFQWNMFHHPVISRSILEIDGVLCPLPPLNSNSTVYGDYIANAKVSILPTVLIDKLVAIRPSKYKDATIKWLTTNHIRYNELIMVDDVEDIATEKNKIANHIGKYYRDSDDILYIGNTLSLSKRIHKISKKNVFCMENYRMLNPDGKARMLIKRWAPDYIFSIYHRLFG